MSVRVRYRAYFAVSSTTAETADLGKIDTDVVTDGQGEGGTWQCVLAPGDTDVPLQLTGLAVGRMLVIRTQLVDPTLLPSDIEVKLEDAMAVAMVIRPLSPTKEGFFAITTDSVTALFVSNPGTSAMKLTIVAAGD
jgi:hypothetical protein